jgi:DNA-binding MarR family transcriptional regulator
VTGPTVLYLIKQVELAVRSHLDAVVESAGLTTQLYTALTVLERHPGITAAELARMSFIRPQTAAQTVNALEARDLVERIRADEDRRRIRLVLAPRGQRVLDQLREPVAELEERMLRAMDPEARAALRAALVTARSALDQEPVKTSLRARCRVAGGLVRRR